MTPRIPDPHEKVYASQTWESLLPGAIRRHVWLVTANVSLTLVQPDGQSRTAQIRRCVALGVDAHSLLLVQESRRGAPS